eukprot:scaffold1928_cov381-Prasinococcus_capsulatus_cf.AAC.3
MLVRNGAAPRLARPHECWGSPCSAVLGMGLPRPNSRVFAIGREKDRGQAPLNKPNSYRAVLELP